MGKKRASWAKQAREFNDSLAGGGAAGAGGLDSLFAAESNRTQQAQAQKEAHRREKACGSKNRYATQAQAQAAIASCAEYGRTGLSCYRCPYCKGWHLTSHPWD